MCLSKRMTCVGSQWKKDEWKLDSESQAGLIDDLDGSYSNLFFF